jgi:hypothetical protein
MPLEVQLDPVPTDPDVVVRWVAERVPEAELVHVVYDRRRPRGSDEAARGSFSGLVTVNDGADEGERAAMLLSGLRSEVIGVADRRRSGLDVGERADVARWVRRGSRGRLGSWGRAADGCGEARRGDSRAWCVVSVRDADGVEQRSEK